MSLLTAYRCDRCSAAIDRDRTTLEPKCGPLATYSDRLDLCGPCASGLADWLAALAPAEGAPAHERGQHFNSRRESASTLEDDGMITAHDFDRGIAKALDAIAAQQSRFQAAASCQDLSVLDRVLAELARPDALTVVARGMGRP